ncbi:MAG TPA: septum formation protein Maf [Actinobacteria bacterium]|nr:septum formation protein Maf [Actinomycetota bacterium]
MLEQEESFKTKIILASASPRRKEIFERLGLDFKVMAAEDCVEQRSGDPARIVEENSIAKARDVLGRIGSRKDRYLVSGFDTIVNLKRRILGKPSDIEEAYSFISSLSGKVHRVISGVCIIDSMTGRCESDTEITEVRFRNIEPEEIRTYLAREDVLDKAGAYNIGGAGALLAEKINGCFFNVMGVPVFKFVDLLKRFNYKILDQSKE